MKDENRTEANLLEEEAHDRLFCLWAEDPIDPCWRTECGEAHVFETGGPKEKGCG